jgi:hypothetical protein
MDISSSDRRTSVSPIRRRRQPRRPRPHYRLSALSQSQHRRPQSPSSGCRCGIRASSVVAVAGYEPAAAFLNVGQSAEPRQASLPRASPDAQKSSRPSGIMELILGEHRQYLFRMTARKNQTVMACCPDGTKSSIMDKKPSCFRIYAGITIKQ